VMRDLDEVDLEELIEATEPRDVEDRVPGCCPERLRPCARRDAGLVERGRTGRLRAPARSSRPPAGPQPDACRLAAQPVGGVT
jgi:hypothetical protein